FPSPRSQPWQPILFSKERSSRCPPEPPRAGEDPIMTTKCAAALALAIMLVLAVVAALSAQAQTFTTFDAPGAGTGTNQGTLPLSINTAGATAGIYLDGSNLAHGFVRA